MAARRGGHDCHAAVRLRAVVCCTRVCCRLTHCSLLLDEPTEYYPEDRQSVLTLFADVNKSQALRHSTLFLFISRINLLEDMINSGADVKRHLPSDYHGNTAHSQYAFMSALITESADINARSIILYFIDKFWELHDKDRPLFVICGDIVDKQAMKLIIPYIVQTMLSGTC